MNDRILSEIRSLANESARRIMRNCSSHSDVLGEIVMRLREPPGQIYRWPVVPQAPGGRTVVG